MDVKKLIVFILCIINLVLFIIGMATTASVLDDDDDEGGAQGIKTDFKNGVNRCAGKTDPGRNGLALALNLIVMVAGIGATLLTFLALLAGLVPALSVVLKFTGPPCSGFEFILTGLVIMSAGLFAKALNEAEDHGDCLTGSFIFCFVVTFFLCITHTAYWILGNFFAAFPNYKEGVVFASPSSGKSTVAPESPPPASIAA